MHTHNLQPSQRGFSLVEILLTLGLIASISIGAFLLYPRMRLSQDINATETKFISLVSATKEYFSGSSFAGLTGASASSAGIVDAPDLLSPWGTIDIQATDGDTRFRVDFLTLPKEACQKLVSRLEPYSDEVRIGATTYVKNSTTTYSALGAPAACSATAQTVSFWPNKE